MEISLFASIYYDKTWFRKIIKKPVLMEPRRSMSALTRRDRTYWSLAKPEPPQSKPETNFFQQVLRFVPKRNPLVLRSSLGDPRTDLPRIF